MTMFMKAAKIATIRQTTAKTALFCAAMQQAIL
jgi:hypothetical protein